MCPAYRSHRFHKKGRNLIPINLFGLISRHDPGKDEPCLSAPPQPKLRDYIWVFSPTLDPPKSIYSLMYTHMYTIGIYTSR
jgi:hypothetical protein